MTLPPAPKSTKQNQHIVPRFWQARFAGPGGHIYARFRAGTNPSGRQSAGARQVGASSIMSQDWTYTVFDRWWRPSDALENDLSKLEGQLSQALASLDPTGTVPDMGLTWELCRFVGLAACRTPEVMARGHRRLKELALALSEAVGAESFERFRDEISRRFGVMLSESDYIALRKRPASSLTETAKAIGEMSPQNPVLPEQVALTGIETVAMQVGEMTLELFDAPGTHEFILGDTPLADWDLAKGFTLPLSRSLALNATQRMGAWSLPTRRTATAAEVEASNGIQYAHARDVVIGPDKGYLDGLV